jgi:hypothetical protein
VIIISRCWKRQDFEFNEGIEGTCNVVLSDYTMDQRGVDVLKSTTTKADQDDTEIANSPSGSYHPDIILFSVM